MDDIRRDDLENTRAMATKELCHMNRKYHSTKYTETPIRTKRDEKPQVLRKIIKKNTRNYQKETTNNTMMMNVYIRNVCILVLAFCITYLKK